MNADIEDRTTSRVYQRLLYVISYNVHVHTENAYTAHASQFPNIIIETQEGVKLNSTDSTTNDQKDSSIETHTGIAAK